MKAGFVLYGMKDVQRRLVAAVEKADNLARIAVKSACVLVEIKTKDKLRGQRSGREYTVPGTKVKYKASRPGEPPALRTGQLRSSITWNIENREKTVPYTYKGGAGTTTIPATGTRKMNIIGLVGTNVEYGRFLELGTASIEPRPFLFPTLKEQQKTISILFRETLKKL
jgi:HK97 gp10 family phage protein